MKVTCRHLPRPFARGAALAVIVAHLGTFIPAAEASQHQDASGPDQAERTGEAKPVDVNRTVPRVQQAALMPVFSSQPTVAEIAAARVFEEPIVPVGGAPTDAENRMLVEAIREYQQHAQAEAVAPFLTFISRFPQGAWRASVQANLGNVYERTGYFSKAQAAWADAWHLAKYDTSPAARAVADRSISELMDLTSKLGDTERLEELTAAIEGRQIDGPAAERIAMAREALWFLKNDHHAAVPSGPLALQQLLMLANPGAPPNATLEGVHATPNGMTMPALFQLSKEVGMDLQLAHRAAGAAVIVPAVVHLKVGHFSAVVAEQDGRVLLRDPIFGGDIWISRQALDEETGGYFLVRAGSLPTGWRVATVDETQALVGRCGLGFPWPGDNGGPSCGPPASGPPNPDPGPGCGGNGMAVYDFDQFQVGLRVWDIPVGYTPPKGPAVDFLVRYNQRDQFQPQTFTYSNLGPKWTFDFMSYVTDTPNAPTQAVTLYPRGGGGEQQYATYDAGTSSYERHWRTNAPLVRTGTNPIRYERRLPNGSVEVFAQADGASSYPRRVFMTEWRDPQGHALQFTYDGTLRMVAVTDAIGQVTTVAYELAAQPLKITKVTDPFGRSAVFQYNSAGQLGSITDVIGLTSSFRYGNSSFMAGLTTLYGTTTFRMGDMVAGSNRFIEATDPLGGTERLEYHHSSSTLAATVATNQVPTGFAVRNANLNEWSSVYWDKLAHARHPGDVTKAVVTKWMRNRSNLYVVGIKHSEQRPLESRIWYLYPDEDWANYRGRLVTPSKIGRVLDDGTSQVWEIDYNLQGYPTARRDPLGRETSYTYATNGIDLLEVRQTTAATDDLLASYGTYDARHRPASVTDAAGQTTAFTYNTAGQLLTATNAKQETTTWTYDTNGYLTSVAGPVSGATTSLTYDAYGRPRTVTNPDQDTITTTYDAFDRPTIIAYPNSTEERLTYDRLHLASSRDRTGRTTRFFYDPLRRLTLVRDPLGRAVRQDWCACGTLDALVDANGRKTTWERDVRGRVTREVRETGNGTEYVYESTTNRLKSVTDPKEQVTTYTYAADDALLQTTYTDEEEPTPDVTFTYQTAYARVATMGDGLGTTTYAYKAAGQLGAGAVASIDGPRTNDTLTYGYDELGRVVSRALNSVAVTWEHDALGRVDEEVNPLGTFTYAYDGVTGRLASATYPNGQTSAYSYLTAANDRRLQTMHHTLSGGATLSKFDYTYDGIGNILTWQQQADAAAATKWEYGYDAADQLTAAVKLTTGGTPAVLARYGYRYDAGGNRTAEQVDDVVTGATYDALNRLTTHTAAGALRIAGQLNEAATVTIDGAPASVSGTHAFVGVKQLASGTNTFTVAATDASGNTDAETYEVDADGTNRTFAYDANGNMTGDGSRTFEWDAQNRLLAVVNGTNRSEFTYDGLDRRVRFVEKDSGVTTRDANLFWAGTEIIEERLATSEVNRFFADGEQHNGAARYLTRDHLGSVREVTDGSGTLKTRNDYDPYGRLTRVGGTEDSRFSYTGHMAHTPTGLALTLYRAYAPELGRWLSEDPAGHIDGPNLYGYVRNQATVAWDPSGRFLAIPGLLALSPAELALLATGGAAAIAAAYNVTVEVAQQVISWAKSKKDAEDEATRERKFEEDLAKNIDKNKKNYPVERRPEDIADDLRKQQDGFRRGGRDQVDSSKKTDDRIPYRPNDPSRKCP